MKQLISKKLFNVSTLITAIFISGCSSASSNSANQLGGVPEPSDKASLVGMHYQKDGISFKYYRGYSLSMVNTLQKSQPSVGAEPLAYIQSCKNKIKPALGELRFEQYGYKAKGQDGRSYSLKCELMPVSEEWLVAFLDAFPTCLNKGLETIKWEKPQSVIVHSVMIYQHKGSSGRMSLHAPGRAVDFSKLELVYASDSKDLVVAKASKKNNPINQDTTTERKFYETFRQCWGEHLVQKHGCSEWKKEGHRGSVGWEDSDHQKHIHLSRPYCPPNSNYLGG